MVFCSKCGQENPDDAKYCSKCGSLIKDYGKNEVKPVEKKVETIEKNNKSPNKTIKYISYVVIILAILTLILLPTKTIYETKQEAYTDYENYIVQEPYLKEEIYQTNEVVEEEVCNNKEVYFNSELKYNDGYYSSYNLSCEFQISSVSLNEYDNTNPSQNEINTQDVLIKIEYVKYDENDNEIERLTYDDIDFNEGKKPIRYLWYKRDDVNFGNVILTSNEFAGDGGKFTWDCEITNWYGDEPTFNFCKDEDVLKPTNETKQVTAYKDVTKQRAVTKYRDVQVAKKVNWLLGVSFFWNN